jgi:hypothetical protein
MTYATIHAIRFIILSAVIVCSFFFGSQAHAYYTTNQNAVVLDTHSVLFTIEYAFGNMKHDIYMPILAYNTTATTDTAVSYEILDTKGNIVSGKVSGIVLSATSMKNGMYIAPKGHKKSFTLAVIFTPTDTTSKNEYRLHITHLPFNFDNTQQLKLNPSELQYYITKPISF